jgi:GNAT superfamily N-acetyltransferase
MTDAAPVRLAHPADHAEILRVVNLAYRVEDFFVRGDRLTPSLVTAYALRPGGVFLVIDGDAPGRLAASVYFEARADRGWFAMLAVEPAVQGRGLARVLLDAVEARCRAHGMPWLELEVVDLRTELPAFYERLGFEVTGRRPFPDPEKLKVPAVMLVMGKRVLAAG